MPSEETQSFVEYAGVLTYSRAPQIVATVDALKDHRLDT
jgi:hypothetical protein